tara:strand:+ start:2807 stop:3091 length:285 start_codon:yes stop_codon:yes gene_type:complete
MFKSRKEKKQDKYDIILLNKLTSLNEYQSMLVDSVYNNWPIDSVQEDYIKSFVNYELRVYLQEAQEHASSGLLKHIHNRRNHFARLYNLIQQCE